MTVLLLLVAVYTILGGMLSVLVTDFLQFVVMSVGLLAVTVLILCAGRLGAGWSPPCRQRHGAGGFNPLRQPADGLAVRALQRPASTWPPC